MSDSKEIAGWRELDNILYNKLTGLEQIVALNDYKSGGEADAGRLAAMHGKTRQNIYTTRSKVKKEDHPNDAGMGFASKRAKGKTMSQGADKISTSCSQSFGS